MAFTGSTFETNEPLLLELLGDIRKGVVQLPDFQRGWVWDDQHIRSLIASVSLAYPIGAVMLLETGGDGIRFRPRLVEGVVLSSPRKPDKLILDGQQRLTSLYLALISSAPVKTRTEKGVDISRYYYFDMTGCLDPETERTEAVVGVPPDRVVRRDFAREVVMDLSTREREYENSMLPLSLLFDQAQFYEWLSGYRQHYSHDSARSKFLDRFQQEVWLKFQQYKVPVIELLRGTEKEAVCQVFEKVNTGGVTLSVFELLTATFAADDFLLRDDWETRSARMYNHEVLKGVESTDFLMSVTLLSSYRASPAVVGDGKPPVTCKRRDVLKLTLEEYRAHADDVQAGFERAARLLTREKVFDANSLPYTSLLIPLAAICAALGERFEQDTVRQRLCRWYWCGVFGELYGGANETRFAQDLPDVVNWIDGGNEPRTVIDSSFAPVRLLSMQTRNSAAYKGLMVLLMQVGSQDFRSGDPIELTNYFDEAVDIHHLFPAAHCERMQLPRQQWNSVVNKAPLTATTNRFIGGRAPSAYLKGLTEHGVTTERLNSILTTHCVAPETMYSDNFPEFFRRRAMALLDLIEQATGKKVPGRDSEETALAFGGPLVNEQLPAPATPASAV